MNQMSTLKRSQLYSFKFIFEIYKTVHFKNINPISFIRHSKIRPTFFKVNFHVQLIFTFHSLLSIIITTQHYQDSSLN